MGKVNKEIVKVLGVMFVAFAATISLHTWVFMLLLGAAHTFFSWIPALGLGQSFIILILIRIVGYTLFADIAKFRDQKS
jgi:hypothetical protein